MTTVKEAACRLSSALATTKLPTDGVAFSAFHYKEALADRSLSVASDHYILHTCAFITKTAPYRKVIVLIKLIYLCPNQIFFKSLNCEHIIILYICCLFTEMSRYCPYPQPSQAWRVHPSLQSSLASLDSVPSNLFLSRGIGDVHSVDPSCWQYGWLGPDQTETPPLDMTGRVTSARVTLSFVLMDRIGSWTEEGTVQSLGYAYPFNTDHSMFPCCVHKK